MAKRVSSMQSSCGCCRAQIERGTSGCIEPLADGVCGMRNPQAPRVEIASLSVGFCQRRIRNPRAPCHRGSGTSGSDPGEGPTIMEWAKLDGPEIKMGLQPRSGDIPWLSAHSILNWIGGDTSMLDPSSKKSSNLSSNRRRA